MNYYDPLGKDAESIWKNIFEVAVFIGLTLFVIGTVCTSGVTVLMPILIGAGIGAGLNLVGQVASNVFNGENAFKDVNLFKVALGSLLGAAFATGIGGLGGIIVIGAASNAGMSALEGKSWLNIGISAAVGGVAAGIGYGLGRYVSSKVFDIDGNMSLKILGEMTKVDGAGFLRGILTVLTAKGYTMSPTITTSLSRGLIKFLGNKIGGLF